MRFLLICEYVLSGNRVTSLVLAAAAVICCFGLTEYYLLPYAPWWGGPMEHVFIVLPVLLLILLVLFCGWRISRERGPAAGLLLTPQDALPAPVWAAMMRECARHRKSKIARSFLRWQAGLLDRFGGWDERVKLARVPGVWRFPAKRARANVGRFRTLRTSVGQLASRLIAWFWFPALLVILLSTSLPTYVAEQYAEWRGWPEHIYAVNAWADVRRETVFEGLTPDADGTRFERDRTAPYGACLSIYAADLPRAYRSIAAVCAGDVPACSLWSQSREALKPLEPIPLRTGRAVVCYNLASADAVGRKLNLEVYLLSADGNKLHNIVVE